MKETTLTRNQFNKVLEERISLIQTSLKKKNEEYATDDKPLHNFYESAKAGRTTPKDALFGYMLKHIVSVTDMVKSDKKYPKALWQEKIGDIINYLILLEGLVEEENIQQQDKNAIG